VLFDPQQETLKVKTIGEYVWEAMVNAVSDISTRLLAQASVKSVGVQILDHSPVSRVQFLSPRNYLKIKIKNDFTLHFG